MTEGEGVILWSQDDTDCWYDCHAESPRVMLSHAMLRQVTRRDGD